MSRRKWCREHITEMKENCGLTDHELWRMERANDFEEGYEELQICNLTTDALDPLMKKKNQEVQQEAVTAVIKVFQETKVAPTRKEVEQIISELRKDYGLDGDEPDPAPADQEIEEPQDITTTSTVLEPEVHLIPPHKVFNKSRGRWEVVIKKTLVMKSEAEADEFCATHMGYWT